MSCYYIRSCEEAYIFKTFLPFRCYDHVDEVVAARSLAFDPTGQKLYVGLKNEICIFDVAIPGRKCVKRKTFTAKDGGLNGIISSIAVSNLIKYASKFS